MLQNIVWLHVLVTLALEGGSHLASFLGRFSQGKERAVPIKQEAGCAPYVERRERQTRV